jgi:hypothetical protein
MLFKINFDFLYKAEIQEGSNLVFWYILYDLAKRSNSFLKNNYPDLISFMPISLPEDITKNLQSTKNFFGSSIDAAVNTLNQNTQKTKTIILESTSQSIQDISQITQNTRENLAEVTDNTIGSVTEKTSQLINGITSTASTLRESLQTTIDKIDDLNHTLAEGIQSSIDASLNSWIDNHPQLVWLINHPLQGLGLLILLLIMTSGLLGAISDITKKFWLLLFTFPLKIISNVWIKISSLSKNDNDGQKNISGETETQKRIAEILNRLEVNRKAEGLLLQELDSLLKR